MNTKIIGFIGFLVCMCVFGSLLIVGYTIEGFMFINTGLLCLVLGAILGNRDSFRPQTNMESYNQQPELPIAQNTDNSPVFVEEPVKKEIPVPIAVKPQLEESNTDINVTEDKEEEIPLTPEQEQEIRLQQMEEKQDQLLNSLLELNKKLEQKPRKKKKKKVEVEPAPQPVTSIGMEE